MPLPRAIALNIIKSFVPLNMPGNAIMRHLREFGVSYHKQTMVDDIRAAYGRIKYETQVRGLRDDQKVSEAWMHKEKLGEPYNYRVHLKVEYYDPDTMRTSIEDRYMFEDEYLTTGEYANDFPYYSQSVGCVQERDYVSVKVIGVSKNVVEGVSF